MVKFIIDCIFMFKNYDSRWDNACLESISYLKCYGMLCVWFVIKGKNLVEDGVEYIKLFWCVKIYL